MQQKPAGQPQQATASHHTQETAPILGSAAIYDNRSKAVAQRRLADAINQSARVAELRDLSAMMNGSDRRVAQGNRLGMPDAAAHLEGSKRATPPGPLQRRAAPALPQNNTGLTDKLRFGIETLSGVSMNNVKVHYNSSQPAQLNALAYAQGANIYVGPGQERHLPHEAWHVVQQTKGRVRPTRQLQSGHAINDETGLEREADTMGARAAAIGSLPRPSAAFESEPPSSARSDAPAQGGSTLEEAGGSDRRRSAVSDRVQAGVNVMQRRPADIFKSYSIPFRYDVANNKDRYAGFKGQRSPHAAQPINSLRQEKVIKTNPDKDFIGGHLLKAEYGGKDEPNNVVPWTASTESNFTDHYEDKYLKKIEQYREFARNQKRIDNDGNWSWPFYVSVQFQDWPDNADAEVQRTLSAIPSAVTVNAGNGLDFFHITGKEISGEISVLKPDGVDASAKTENEEGKSNAKNDEGGAAKQKFQTNLHLYLSRVNDDVEEARRDAWNNEIVTYAKTVTNTLKTGLLAEVDAIISSGAAHTPVPPQIHTRVETSWTNPLRSGPSESARREALANPISIPARTESAAKAAISEKYGRFRQILLNNLIGLHASLGGSDEDKSKADMAVFIEACFAQKGH
jgi:Domain of unknown function (DUF4157)